VFKKEGRLYRQINHVYAEHYKLLMQGGLYKALIDQGLLVAHTEIPTSNGAFKVVEPELIPFVSYPFEWSFSQLKQAALTTLRVQRLAIKHGMVLKDASAYNIQFKGTQPILIDTLSFESWREGTPWVAYRQFCQHFLGPLALMSRTDVRLGQLSRVFIDGPPLDLVSSLLPSRSRLSPSLLMHVHLHARAQARHGRTDVSERNGASAFKRQAMLGLVDHLESAVTKLTGAGALGPWADYYDKTNYSPEAMADKHAAVGAYLEQARPKTVWDLGANTGAFSRLAAAQGAYTVAFDGDATAVERHYADCLKRNERNVLPLVVDLTNPSGKIGWAHEERLSLVDRAPADTVLALGLIHHLRIANQVPFAMVAEFFGRLAPTLIIELPSPADSQVREMLSRIPALAAAYSREMFETEFGRFFRIDHARDIAHSERRLYLMRRTHTPA
jgi:ribosomal protein L11 methylase PrmA